MLMAIAAPMSLDAQELIRRFLLHILPKSFMRIRHYGLSANRAKAAKLAAARTTLNTPRQLCEMRKRSSSSCCA
jgi:hypothetical protein